MNIITIPKKLARKEDLIVIPRSEYEALLGHQKSGDINLTKSQKKALVQAEKNLKLGKSLTLNELSSQMGFKD